MLGILLALAYTFLFIFLIKRWSFFQIDGISRNALTSVFIVKLFFGVVFWAVYTYYYTDKADAFLYFNDGKAIYQAFYERPLDYIKILLGSDDPALFHYIKMTGHWDRTFNQGLYNETRTIIRFNAIADVFSFGNYHVHTVFICFLSLMGLTGLYKTFSPFLKNKKRELFAIIFLFPSLLFWGSGVLKEGLIFFAMGMLLYHFQKLLHEPFSVKRPVFVFLFAALLSITKIYILLFLMPALIAHTWIAKTGNRNAAIKYLVVFISLTGIVLLQKKFDVPYMLMDKQRQSIYMAAGGTYLGKQNENRFVYIKREDSVHHVIQFPDKKGYCKIIPGTDYVTWYGDDYTDSTYVRHSNDTTTYWIYYDQKEAGSRIEIPLLYPSYTSILKNAPSAFLTTVFRPTVFEIKNPMMLMSAFENVFTIIFILLCLVFISKKTENRHLIYFCLSIVILLFVLVGLSTPILGAIVRYKIPALPFFLIAFLLMLDKEKLLEKLPFMKKFIR